VSRRPSRPLLNETGEAVVCILSMIAMLACVFIIADVLR
jgi:hypothetical protein